MGLFDSLFKPDINKLRRNKDINGLARGLNHKDTSIRSDAALALGEIGNPEVTDLLINALKDKESIVRENAAFALGEILDARAIGPLSAALEDPTSKVKEKAAKALDKIKEADAKRREIKVQQSLRHLKLPDNWTKRDLDAREEAISTLSKLGGKREIEPLLKLLYESSLGADRALVGIGERIGKEEVTQPVFRIYEACCHFRWEVLYPYIPISHRNPESQNEFWKQLSSIAESILIALRDERVADYIAERAKTERSPRLISTLDSLGRLDLVD